MNKDKQPEPCDNVWCAWHVSNRPAHHAENGCTSLYSNIHREGNCELLKKWQSRPDPIGEKVDYSIIIEIVNPSGKVSYTRPIGHPDIQEALNTDGYSLRVKLVDHIGEIREYVESAIKKSTDGCIRGGDMLGFLNKLERGEQ